MTRFDATWLKTGVARRMARTAERGLFTGQPGSYLTACTAYHAPSGTLLIYTRDSGYHSSGWWKNPDYERCYHLSLSFCDPLTDEHAPKDEALTAEWLELFFGDDRRKLWCEPPYSEDAKRREVWHYRLFCDAGWQSIVPRGEVYSRELTEAGWLSYSDLRDRRAREAAAAMEAMG